MSTISSISELLELSDSQYRIYDLSRTITKLSKEQFSKIEQNNIPYPFPSQGHAFLAITFWQGKQAQPYLWFVKLPLDERGLLNQGARNHFIAIIIEALGSDLSVNPTEKQEELLKNNPYHFTPSQYKLAFLNSLISHSLNQTPSKYYPQAWKYLTGELGWESWQEVGVQGLCDFVVRLDDKALENTLINALPNLPEQVLVPVLSAIENIKLPYKVIDILIPMYKESEKAQLTSLQPILLRSLSSSCGNTKVSTLIDGIINKADFNEEVAIVIAARCWQAIKSMEDVLAYLEVLANKHPQDLFQGLFKDLVAIPSMRILVLQAIRSPERSEKLIAEIGLLFQK